MSLNVYLNKHYWRSYDKGKTWEPDEDMVFHINITNNLQRMAIAIGVYDAIWEPKEPNMQAKEIIEPLTSGLAKLKRQPHILLKYEDPGGWGTIESFKKTIEDYLNACVRYPESKIETTR